jgi:hypothetical protein
VDQMNEKQVDQQIEFFFEKPDFHAGCPTPYSQLLLCRLHINICFGVDPVNETKTVWTGTMAILSGIDLLGLYYSGKAFNTPKTFRKFCEDFLGLPEDEAITLYMLRCAMMHTFGLYSKCRLKEKRNYKYWFEAYYGDKSFFIETIKTDGKDLHYKVSFSTLYDKFLIAVDDFHNKLKTDKTLRQNFSKTFSKSSVLGPPKKKMN